MAIVKKQNLNSLEFVVKKHKWNKRLFQLAVASSVLFYHIGVYAVEVEGLFEVELIAESRQPQHRHQAIKKALGIVLTRVIAEDEPLQLDVAQKMLNHAQNFLMRYQYSLAPGGGRSNDKARLMRMIFNDAQIMNLLRISEIKVWNNIRPKTLFWLVVEQNNQRRFFNPDKMADLDNALNQASRINGVPIILPMLDLEERNKISVSEALSANSDRLLFVSERYDVVSALSGRLVDHGHCWSAEWALFFDEAITQWVSPCSALNEAMLKGIEGVYRVLARYYSAKPLLK